MIIRKKTSADIQLLRSGGKILSETLRLVAKNVRPGITLAELDRIAERFLRDNRASPAFKGYSPGRGARPFPATLCTSVNFSVVHGIPRNQPLSEGDIISLDLGVRFKDLYTDGALTVGVGKITKEAERLIKVTREALYRGIRQAKIGNKTGDIGFAIQSWVEKNGFSVIRELVGHGVGYDVHEAPYVPNFGPKSSGIMLEAGMVIAIEPMVSAGTGEVEMLPDGSFITKDRSLAAHFEHTVAITKRGPLILTK